MNTSLDLEARDPAISSSRRLLWRQREPSSSIILEKKYASEARTPAIPLVIKFNYF